MNQTWNYMFVGNETNGKLALFRVVTAGWS